MYIAIPHELYDARNNSEITASMYEVMVWLHRRTDWAMGKVRMVSAERISIELGGMYKARTVQDAMNNLSKCGWITLHRVTGQHGSYWVTIHNFLALTGARKEQVLNLNTITAYKNAAPPECGDGAANTAVTVRRECGDSAPIQKHRDSEPSDSLETHEPKEGRKEGKKDGSSSLRSSSPSDVAQELLKPFDQGTEPTKLELERANYLQYLWSEKTGRGFMEWHPDHDDDFVGEDINAAIRVIRQYSWTSVIDIFTATFECPKTASPGKTGLGWRDWWFWCHKFELTKRTITTWRNKLLAAQEVAKTSRKCDNFNQCQNWALPSRALCQGCEDRATQSFGQELCLHPHRFSYNNSCWDCGQVPEEHCVHCRLDEAGNKCIDCDFVRPSKAAAIADAMDFAAEDV